MGTQKDLVFKGKKITVEEEFDFSNLETLKIQIRKLGSLKKVEAQERLSRIIIAFKQLTKKLDEGNITFCQIQK